MNIAKVLSIISQKKNRFISTMVLISCFCMAASCTVKTPPSRIYFSVKTIGPSVNIYSIDQLGVLTKHTDDDRWRDLEVDVAKNGTMVFASNRKEDSKIDLTKRSDSFDIFLLKKSASEPERLIQDDPTDVTPKLSPNADAVAFIQKLDKHEQLQLMVLSGSQPKVLLENHQIDAYAWSGDGRRMLVAHSNDEQSIVEIIEIESGKHQQLFSLPLKPPIDQPNFRPNDTDEYMKMVAYIRWSPDEKIVAYVRHPVFRGVRQLRLYDIETGKDTLISPPKLQVQDHVDWNKTSDKLLYSGLVDYHFYFDEQTQSKVYDGSMQIFEYSLATENAQLTSGNHMYKNPVYSPDEQYIAYLYSEKLGSRTYQLYTMKKDGSENHQLYDMVAPVSDLTWQLDKAE